MSLTVRDGITPAIRRRLQRVKDTRPVMEAMGAEAVSLTKRAFTDAALRPSPWPPRKDQLAGGRDVKGRFTGHSLLRKSGALWHSIRIVEVAKNFVSWGSDRIYAAIHQLGGSAGRNHSAVIPARPFFPVRDGKITPEARKRIDAVANRKLDSMLK